MFTMQYDIRIGDWMVGMLDSVEIRRSVDLLADTATVVLPGAEYNKALEVEDRIRRGDHVQIWLGYAETGTALEFEGWVQRIGTDNGAVTIECEDDLFKFRVPAGTDLEELELEMIDLEVDEFYPEEDTITVYAPYESFGAIQKWIEDKGFETISGESVRIPVDTKELSAEERESVEKLQERIEEDDDVVNVYTNMREPEDDEADEE